MAWAKLDSTTLVSSADTITSSVFTSKKFIHINSHTLNTGGDTRASLRVGNTTIDTGSNYAYRRNSNGAGEETFTSTDRMSASSGAVADHEYWVTFIINISTQEKLSISNVVRSNTAGAANAPSRHELVGKWVNTSSQIDIDQLFNDQAGSFDSNTNIMTMGTD